jgi:glutamyl-tRNA reductase
MSTSTILRPGEPEARQESTGPPPATRDHAAAMIRQIGGRTEAAMRRELDRFFAARPGLSHADRAAIARAMSRFRNQLLHHPRTTLRAAAAADHPAGAPPLLDAVRRLFGLADPSHAPLPSDAA